MFMHRQCIASQSSYVLFSVESLFILFVQFSVLPDRKKFKGAYGRNVEVATVIRTLLLSITGLN